MTSKAFFSEHNDGGQRGQPQATDLPTPGVVPASREFTVRNITVDQTKYAYTIAALDQDTAGRLLNLLCAPLAENKYQAIKTRVTAIAKLPFSMFGIVSLDATS